MNTERSSQAGRPFGGSAAGQTSVDTKPSAGSVDVVLAMHDDAVRSEFRARLEQHDGFVVTAEKSNAKQALGAALFHSPRVCLLGIDLPDELDARIMSIRAERPDTRIGILARSADQPGLLRAVLAGADGVLLTGDPPEMFMAELGALARGERVLPPEKNESLRRAESGIPVAKLEAEFDSVRARAAPALAPTQPRDTWLKATVLYAPRFLHHLRRRLRARMPFPIAWSSARERMWDYR